MATYCQNVGETLIKMTTETKIILKESPASTRNVTPVEKDSTWLLIHGKRKEKRKTMTWITSLWETHYK